MRLNEEIVFVYKEGKLSDTYNPDTGTYEEELLGRVEETYVCNVSIVRDYIGGLPHGRYTGKTIKVRLLGEVLKPKSAVYGNSKYLPTGYKYGKHKTSIEFEKVGEVDRNDN